LENGEVSEKLIKRYRALAKGEIGLIIPGYFYIHPRGKTMRGQPGLHNDDMIKGLSKLVDAVHNEGSKIAIQLVHAGQQTTKEYIGGLTPLAPSGGSKDFFYNVTPKKMSEKDIDKIIKSFGAAAKRTYEAGADAVQLHAAHGYLINQFLSPFFNKRNDGWGGTDEKRFRFLKETFLEVKKNIPNDMPILIKLNTQDYTPSEGITLSLARKYAQWLADIGINGIEVSCGTLSYSMFNIFRGEIPAKELSMAFPMEKKESVYQFLMTIKEKYNFTEGYTADAARLIRPVIGDVPLFLVGGMRRVVHMEKTVENGDADFISMSRPFIKEPLIVKKFREGTIESASCVSCNKCFAAIVNHMPLACYNKLITQEEF